MRLNHEHCLDYFTFSLHHHTFWALSLSTQLEEMLLLCKCQSSSSHVGICVFCLNANHHHTALEALLRHSHMRFNPHLRLGSLQDWTLFIHTQRESSRNMEFQNPDEVRIILHVWKVYEKSLESKVKWINWWKSQMQAILHFKRFWLLKGSLKSFQSCWDMRLMSHACNKGPFIVF